MISPVMRSVRLLVAAFLASCLPALASAGTARAAGAPPVRLVAPERGTALAAGTTAQLEWAPLAAFARLPAAEEWEAFLSVDGGRTYPLRITPHLDADLRRVRWQVPPVPTADARILLRFGDERRETAVELPGRFSITGPPSPSVSSSNLPARPALAPGEPALPGAAGVVAWVEGSRRGGSLRQVVAAAPLGVAGRFEPPVFRDEAAVPAAGPASPEAPGPAAGNGAGSPPPAGGGAALSPAGTGPSFAFDILLLIQRQNE
jgi:hypothetical protein